MTKTLLLFIFTLLAGSLCAQTAPVEVQQALKNLQADTDLQNASIGFILMDTEHGKELIASNKKQSLEPASILKLITTATALELLGSEHTFATLLQYDGTIDKASGTLNGNIYIRGGGDPMFCSRRLTEANIFDLWAKKIMAAGIKQINGNILADATIFADETTPGGWAWDDMGNYYGAAAYGISLYDNSYYLSLKSGSTQGDATQVLSTEPTIPGIEFVNQITASDSNKDNAYIFGSPFSNLRILRGSIPKGKTNFKIKGAIPNPPLLSAQILYEHIAANSIKISGKAGTLRTPEFATQATKDRQTIDSYKSQPLSKIIELTNHHSINLYAESLLNYVGYQQKQDGSPQGGTEAVYTFWQAKGMNTTGLYLTDGCGLSRSNAITVEQMAFLLNYMSNSPNADVFKQSLAVSGQSGTLKYFCTKNAGKITAKSGSMTRIRSYAGYLTNKTGQKAAFAIIINNYNCDDTKIKAKIEPLINACVDAKW